MSEQFNIILYYIYVYICRSQWLRGLKRRSAAARLLRLWVRIPPGAWVFVCFEVLCVVTATGRSLVQRSPTDCGASLCVTSENLKDEEAIAATGLQAP